MVIQHAMYYNDAKLKNLDSDSTVIYLKNGIINLTTKWYKSLLNEKFESHHHQFKPFKSNDIFVLIIYDFFRKWYSSLESSILGY